MKIIFAALLLVVLLGSALPAQASGSPVGLIVESDHWFLRETVFGIAAYLNEAGIPTVALDDGSVALWRNFGARQGFDPANVRMSGNPFYASRRVAHVQIYTGSSRFPAGFYKITVHDRRSGYSVTTRTGIIPVYHSVDRTKFLEHVLFQGPVLFIGPVLAQMLR